MTFASFARALRFVFAAAAVALVPTTRALAAGLPIADTGGGTGEKPQSKIWFADASWWAVLSRSGVGLHFFEFDSATQSWHPSTFMDASLGTGGRADVRWNVETEELFVLSYAQSPKLFKYAYDRQYRTYNLAAGFPVSVPITGGSETMVLDQDSAQRLWVAWEGGSKIYTAWTTAADHKQWSTPLELRAGVDSDDIATVVAFDHKIGVFWSDQVRDEFGFRWRHDSDPPNTWQAASIVDSGSGLADDHLSLKASTDGTLYCVTKDDFDAMRLHKRNPTTGSWTNKGSVIGGAGTRGITMVSDDDAKVYVAYTDWETTPDRIKLRRASTSTLSFSTHMSAFISGPRMNDVSGTKQVLPAGVFMAVTFGDDDDVWWNGWGEVPPDGPPPPAPPTAVTAGLVERPVPAPDRAELELDLRLDEGSGRLAHDSSPNHHTAGLDGVNAKAGVGPDWVSGPTGSALEFDGESYAQVPSTSGLEIPGGFTLEAWVRLHAGSFTDGTILSKGRSNQRNYQAVLRSDRRIELKWEVSGGTNHGVVSTRGLVQEDWTHVVCIYDREGGQSSVYIDGELDAAAVDSGTPVANSDPLYLGRRISSSGSAADYLHADLDGVRIWDGVAFHGPFTPGQMPQFPFPSTPPYEVRLSWNRPAGEARELVYSIALRRNGRSPQSLVTDLTSTTWTHTNPVFGQLCYEISATSVEDGRRGKPAIVCVEYRRQQQEHLQPQEFAKGAPAAERSSALSANPNPFNPRTEVQLSVAQTGPVHVAIYDVLGRHVRTLHDGHLHAGQHSLPWNGRNADGTVLGSGVYFVRASAPEATLPYRLVLLK